MLSVTNRWKLGLFVVIGFSTAVGAVFWLGAQKFRRETRDFVSFFNESVQGLEVGSPVKFRGVPIGAVSRITVAPDERHVEVHADVYTDVVTRMGLHFKDEYHESLPKDLRIQIVPAGITGVKFLQANFFAPELHPLPAVKFPLPDNYIPSTPSSLTSIEEALVHGAENVPVLTEKLIEIAGHVEEMTRELKTAGLVARLAESVERVEALLGAVADEELPQKLSGALDEGKAAVEEGRLLMAELRAREGALMKALTRAEQLVARADDELAEAKLAETVETFRLAGQDVGDAAQSLGTLGDELQANLISLREALDSVRALADLLERDPGVLLRGKTPEREPEGGHP